MRLKTEIGDLIETVRVIENGSHAGNRITLRLTTIPACQYADQLIREGSWRIVETDPRYMEPNDGQGELIQ
jgi:hypothetical protein